MLVGLDPAAMGLVREVLSAEAALPPGSIGFPDALATMRKSKPDVVIVSYTVAIDAALGLAQATSRELPSVTLVALAQKSAADAILNAMRAGFKEFVVLPDDANRLRQAVKDSRRTTEDSEVDDDKGRVIAFAGAKGGVGTSTIAANIAADLAGIARVLLIDLNMATGDVASVLDVSSKETLHDVLSKIDRLDERVLGNAAAVHKSKVHALIGADDPTAVDHPNAESIIRLIDVAARGYQYVLLDCGTYFDEAVGVALNVSDDVVLISTPDVISVRDAFRRLKAWQSLGLDKKRVRLVVNRWSKQSFLQLKDIETNLGIPVRATIADDQRSVDLALNEGKLIRDANKKSDVVRDLTALMAMLTDDVAEGASGSSEKTSGVGGFFANLFNRG